MTMDMAAATKDEPDPIDFQPSDNMIRVTTVKGEKIEVPIKLTWGQELRAFKAVGGLIRALPALQEIEWDKLANEEERNKIKVDLKGILKFLPEILADGSEHIGDIAAAVLKKEKAWVEENLDMQGVIATVGPFFRAYMAKIGTIAKDTNPSQGETQTT